MTKTKREGLTLSKEQILDQINLMSNQTDRLVKMTRYISTLEQALFHEKWKFRYVARLLKQYAPHEAVSEEELDEQIKQKSN